MSVDALRWLVLLLNLCLSALVSLFTYIFFFVPPPPAPSVPNVDLGFIQGELARKDNTDTTASMAKFMVIVNTMDPPPPPTPPGPTPEEIAKAAAEEAAKAGGEGGKGGKRIPSGPLQSYVTSSFEVEMVFIDTALNRSTAALLIKKERVTEVYPVGRTIEGERPVRIKDIKEVGDGDARYFEVIFTDDSAQDAVLEYKPEEES